MRTDDETFVQRFRASASDPARATRLLDEQLRAALIQFDDATGLTALTDEGLMTELPGYGVAGEELDRALLGQADLADELEQALVRAQSAPDERIGPYR